jgi:Fur family peroxide stress response transcriptional regulator
MATATRKLRKSKQRDRILEILREGENHPTAADVYDRIKPEFPSASLGNVYRNLNILVDQGLVRRFASGSTFDRFEAVSQEHSHFVCRRCGTIYDIPAPELKAYVHAVRDGYGHVVEHMNLDIEGLCRACAERDHAEG